VNSLQHELLDDFGAASILDLVNIVALLSHYAADHWRPAKVCDESEMPMRHYQRADLRVIRFSFERYVQEN
jgi:hypothetical protein